MMGLLLAVSHLDCLQTQRASIMLALHDWDQALFLPG